MSPMSHSQALAFERTTDTAASIAPLDIPAVVAQLREARER